MSQNIPIDLVDAGEYRIRLHIPKAEDLAANIAQLGLLEPIGVLSSGDRFQLLYGERRLQAVKSLGWSTVPAIVHTDKKTALLLTLTENLQRKEMNPLEEARVYRRLLNAGMTQDMVAKLIGKTQSYVAQKLRLEKLPYGVIILLEIGVFTEAHLRQILRIEQIAKDTGYDKVPDFLRYTYEEEFERNRQRAKEGMPNNGVVDMVTYHQDRFVWSCERGTVADLKQQVDELKERWEEGE